jgi:hypothetical protein
MFLYEEETTESKGRTEDDPQQSMLNLEDEIEKLKDHGLDVIIERETPMQILNLTLQEQHRNILEGLFSEDDDYADWIKVCNCKRGCSDETKTRKRH